VGDEIAVGAGIYSSVIAFTHKMPDMVDEFVVLTTASEARITLSGGHYIFIYGKDGKQEKLGALRRADNAHVGDFLEIVTTNAHNKDVMYYSPIVLIEIVKARGLFNPQTIDGKIVVDGVLCSTYTDAVAIDVGHAALAPLRFIYATFGSTARFLQDSVW